MHTLFVYGTLLTGLGNWRSFLDPQEGTPNTLAGYTMYSLGGFPAIVATGNPEDVIRGEVFEINDDQLQRIDLLEGYSGEGEWNHYDRIEVKLGNGVTAFTYVYANPERLQTRPTVPHGDWRQATNPRLE